MCVCVCVCAVPCVRACVRACVCVEVRAADVRACVIVVVWCGVSVFVSQTRVKSDSAGYVLERILDLGMSAITQQGA